MGVIDRGRHRLITEVQTMVRFEMKKEGKSNPVWVIRRDGKAVFRTAVVDRANRQAKAMARGTADRENVDVLLVVHQSDPSREPLECLWTPETAREGIERDREWARGAIADGHAFAAELRARQGS